MKATSEIIGTHTGTGPDASGRIHKIGSLRAPGEFNKIPDPLRIFQIIGIAGGSIVSLEGSLDGGTSWAVYASGIDADTFVEVPQGPVIMRSNCTTYGSGTVSVYCQKFIEE